MDSLLQAILLGIVEGLTEFLPISSTGHLLIAQEWLDRRSDLFNIAIQLGAILAVTLVYRERLTRLLTRWPSDAMTRDELIKTVAAFVITGVLGLAAKLGGVELPETVIPVAAALIIGGVVIFAVERWASKQQIRDDLTWGVVVAVGVAQVIAGVFPGTSRSGAAIFAALLFGLTHRARAAEFAFTVGIPTMAAATAFELLKAAGDEAAWAAESWTELGAAFLVSAIVGFATVKWLLGFISGHSFVAFGWYRIALGGVLLAMFL